MNLPRFLLLFLAIPMTSMPALASGTSNPRDLGIPVKGVSWARLHPGKTADGRASLLASMSQNNGGLFVLDIDLATGHCRQFAVHDTVNSTFSAASFRSLLTGVLYVVSGWDGHLHRFDANHPERGLEDLGRIHPAAGDIAPLGINEGPDGVLWIGTYPGATLTKYDPATGKFTCFGKKDDTDNYLYPLAGDDGSLAGIVTFGRPHLLVFDPRTGASREVGPSVTDPTDKSQFLKFFKGTDRRLYLDSHAGKFRVDGLNLTPVDELPAPLPGIHATYKHAYQAPAEMPGGWTAQFLDDGINGVGVPRNVLLTNRDPLVPSRRLHLDWVGGGSNLHVIDVGPDGKLYGSSYMPNRLFTSSVDGKEISDLGEHTFAGGEAYSMICLDGKLYLGSYPEARLSVFDPAQPLHFGTGPNDNPRDLGRLDNIGYRPNAMVVTPDGRLWMGASPDYGLYGGTLAVTSPGGGQTLGKTATGFAYTVGGLERVLTGPGGHQLFDVSTRTTTPLEITGTSRADRVIVSGALEITHHLAGYKVTLVPDHLTWASTCTCAVSGSLTGTLSGGKHDGKSATVTLTGCGEASIAIDGQTDSITLDRCMAI